MIWNIIVNCLCGAVIAELAWQLRKRGKRIDELEREVERLTNPAPCFENRKFRIEKIEIKRKVDVAQILQVDPIGHYVNEEAGKRQIIDEAMTQVRKEVLERADVNVWAIEDHNGIITARGRMYVAHEVGI